MQLACPKTEYSGLEKAVAMGLFVISMGGLTGYLFLQRYGESISLLIAWIAITGMVGVIVWQIYQDAARPELVLAQIFLLSLAAHLISVIPFENGAANQDFAPYFYTTKLIMEHGFWGLHNVVREPPYSDWQFAQVMPTLAKYPMLYIIAIGTHKITTIDLATVCHWLPSVWSSAGVIAIYLIARMVYNENRVALFSALGFSTYITFIQFHSQYVRESIAFTLMLFAIWAFLRAYREKKRPMTIVAMLLCTATVLSHWNVSLMLVGILGVLTISSKVTSFLVRAEERPPWAFVLLVAVMLLSHGLFVDIGAPTQAVGETNRIVEQAAAPLGLWPFLAPERFETAKSIQVSYASWIFSVCLALGMLWAIIVGLRQKQNQVSFHIAAGAWSLIIFTVYCIGLGDAALHPGRYAIFLYPLAIISAASLTKGGKVAPMSVSLIIAFTLSGFWRAL